MAEGHGLPESVTGLPEKGCRDLGWLKTTEQML